ncbi:RHS repeat domain-containing protein [Fangia hongkongensis]|uniref:RHS repeat domain-containing protein n=1 Tax=Fangia hongkongensis TaxID=270495 RepID=UPI0003A43413|nr:RHS repeat-associated core domain-containing protein [Fangia hongkongensis]MBK2125112.1 RHS repeat-associated core domain-containing protein [Fangia hongkongensis]
MIQRNNQLIILFMMVMGLLCSISLGAANTQYYRYDMAGNLTQVVEADKVLLVYEYNALNQLLYFRGGDNETYQYGYYSNGLRFLKKNVNADHKHIFFYKMNGGVLLNEKQYAQQQSKEDVSYIFLNRYVHNEIEQNSILQLVLFVRHNIPLSVSFLPMQVALQTRHITDYGMIQNNKQSNERNITDTEQSNPFIFAGGYFDQESHLLYLQSRYYSNKMGSFISQDAKNLLNRYRYANSNPVMNYDPSGHNAIQDVIGTSALVLSPVIGMAMSVPLIRVRSSLVALTLGGIIGSGSSVGGFAVNDLVHQNTMDNQEIKYLLLIGAIGGMLDVSMLRYAKSLKLRMHYKEISKGAVVVEDERISRPNVAETLGKKRKKRIVKFKEGLEDSESSRFERVLGNKESSKDANEEFMAKLDKNWEEFLGRKDYGKYWLLGLEDGNTNPLEIEKKLSGDELQSSIRGETVQSEEEVESELLEAYEAHTQQIPRRAKPFNIPGAVDGISDGDLIVGNPT